MTRWVPRATTALLPPLLPPLSPAFVSVSLLCAAVSAAVVGLPTAILPSEFFTRMTPVRPLDYVFWLATALLSGLLLATYVPGVLRSGAICRKVDRAGEDGTSTRLSLGGLLSVLAVGCPTCNKLVVLSLGAGGALTYFAPLQPLLGAASLGLIVYALIARLRAIGVLGVPGVPGELGTRGASGNPSTAGPAVGV